MSDNQTENEKLRALLAEAQKVLAYAFVTMHHTELSTRIKAALAEPVAGCTCDCDYVRTLNVTVIRERDEARAAAAHFKAQLREAAEGRLEERAEVERLTQRVRELEHPKSYLPPGPERADAVWAVNHIAAYQRGAEAMREAAATAVLNRIHLSSVALAQSIRALPIPEDK